MVHFSVKHRSECSETDGGSHHSTYIVVVDGDDCFKVSLHRETGRVMPSQFESLSSEFADFEITQTDRVGLRRISVTEAGSDTGIGEIFGNKLMDGVQTVLIDEIEGNSRALRIVRNTLNTDPGMYSFRRSTDKSEIGCIKSPSRAHGRWRTSMITGIIRTLTSREVVVWEGEFSAPDFDFRLILAASIVLHSDLEEKYGR